MGGTSRTVGWLSLALALLLAPSVAACGTSATASPSAGSTSSAPRAVVSNFVGGSSGGGAVDGAGAAARFDGIAGICFDRQGLLWVADVDMVRTVTSSGLVTTLAGKARALGYRNGSGAQARFCLAVGVTCVPAGDAAILDSPNNLIRTVTPDGAVTTLAGSYRAQAPSASIGGGGITSDAAGDLYTTDGTDIRKITPDGLVTVVAGKAGEPGYADGRGPAARFDNLRGIACDAAGDLYVADMGNAVIRKITPDGVVSTVAGQPGHVGAGDHAALRDGTRATAGFFQPEAIACAADGSLYVSDNACVRRVAADGSVTTIAGVPFHMGRNGSPRSLKLFGPINALAVAPDGSLYVAMTKTIRKIARK